MVFLVVSTLSSWCLPVELGNSKQQIETRVTECCVILGVPRDSHLSEQVITRCYTQALAYKKYQLQEIEDAYSYLLTYCYCTVLSLVMQEVTPALVSAAYEKKSAEIVARQWRREFPLPGNVAQQLLAELLRARGFLDAATRTTSEEDAVEG